MGRSPIKPLVDRILNGDLDQHLTDWRAEGMSAADIAFKLRTDHRIDVSVATVARWVRKMEEVPATC